jgi:hypothetical protein
VNKYETEELSTEELLGPPPRELLKGIGRLHTTGRAAGWNCTSWVETSVLRMTNPADFRGYVRTEELHAGVARAWFETRADLDAYVKALRAA